MFSALAIWEGYWDKESKKCYLNTLLCTLEGALGGKGTCAKFDLFFSRWKDRFLPLTLPAGLPTVCTGLHCICILQLWSLTRSSSSPVVINALHLIEMCR